MRIARTMVRSVLPCILTVALLLGVISPTTSILAAQASLSVPTNVKWMDGSTATATWEPVSGANYYKISVSAYQSGTLIGSKESGTSAFAVDVQDIIQSISGISNYQSVDVAFKVQAVYLQNSSVVKSSNWSLLSSTINYSLVTGNKLASPTGVSFSEKDLKVSFNEVSNAEYYNIEFYNAENQEWEEWLGNETVYTYDGNVYSGYGGTVTISGGKITVNVSNALANSFSYYPEQFNKDYKIYCKVRACSFDRTKYADSDWVLASGIVNYRYQTGKTVESITISPDNPYVPVGYTYSLGKTIEPIDAYYSSMNWSSNNNSIVTVDSLGTITGVSEGTATVTARVGAASDTANVTVYILETNVVEECEEDVLNNTNEIINSIVAGDAACTDITNVTKAAELIETGMDNEDEFHIDIEQGACGQDYSSAGWNTIESLYSGDPDFDPEYAGAVDVSLELYSENNAGKETSIGNITEFDNEIQFDISIPAGLPAVEPGYVREYSVVRVHDGQYSVLDCTLNADYSVTVESDKFSDFVLVYDDVLDVNAMPSSEFLSSGIAHVQDIGNVGVTIDPETGVLTIGTRGMGKRLEEITIYFNNPTPYSGTLEYRVHVQDIGWMDWVEAGQPAGTEGMSKRIEAIEIRLTGDLAKYYSVEYCVHIQDYGDAQGWVHDGALAGTTGESKRIEEIKIQIVPIGSASTMSVKYRVHVQDYGWEGAYAANGQMSGTSGQSKRLEGIEIFLEGCQYSGGVKYKTHVQDIGWEGSWSQDGEMSGTQGQSKRLEGIAIELYGEVAEYYDIYYRVHAQDIGWLGWACNGAYAGTAARSARLEGIQIVLVPKGGAAPDAGYGGISSVTDVAFVEGF